MASYTRVGIVGGGQLCRMMGEEIARKGLPYGLVAIDPTPECPASPFLGRQIVADYKDFEAIKTLAEEADVVTYEIELANGLALGFVERQVPVHPSPQTLLRIQDKYEQKTFLKNRGLPVPDFRPVETRQDVALVARDFGYPFMLKARTDSYDGRGNFVISREADIDEALRAFGGRELMAERYVDFFKEASVIAARSTTGEIRTYPLGENLHENNILRMTVVPARVDASAARRAEWIAAATLNALEGAGVFGIEMFLADGDILINEIAPRVHNSGHYTIEACQTSQFEQHLRAITGQPLGDTTLLHPAVMINVLGDIHNGPYALEGADGVRAMPGAYLHWYDKKELSGQSPRKMGHITVLGDGDAGELIRKAECARSKLSFKALRGQSYHAICRH